ncbi:MAG: endo alpha-1,4 polygalactosaminidase, partial [Myxococcota bacterium]
MTPSLAASLLVAALGGAHPSAPAIAFHYGVAPPFAELSAFDWVVLDPSVLTPASRMELPPARPIAYAAMGEVHPSAPWFGEVQAGWTLGENRAWGGKIVDLAEPAWRAFLLEKVFPELWQRGFRGFFLDAVDAHVAVVPEGPERERRWDGLVEVVTGLRARFPDAVVVVNRGFERLEALASSVDAVAAESLYAGWDPVARTYRDVSAADRRWLDDQLQRARARGLVTVAIDYLPPRERERAREVGAAIRKLGHVPWVGPPGLDRLGVGQVEIWPREVWLVHDSAAAPLAESAAHRLLAMPLEHLGLRPRYVDVRAPLPRAPRGGEVAGVVVWLEGTSFPNLPGWRQLLVGAVDEGVPLVLFGYLGEAVDETVLERLGARRGRRVHRLSEVAEQDQGHPLVDRADEELSPA